MPPIRLLDACHRTLVAMVLSAFSSLSAAQGAGSWGGAAGIVQAALVVAGMVYLLGIWIVWHVVKAFGARGTLRLVVTIVISCLPLAYCEFKSQRLQAGMAAQDQALFDFRAESQQYIANKCPTERRASAPLLLPAGTGIFLSDANVTPPVFANVPPASLPTAKMKRNQERYGTNYPNEASRDEQFGKPLHWTSLAQPEHVLAEGPAFVEYTVPPWKVKKRLASFRWWKENTEPARLEKLIREHTEANYLTLKDDDLLTIPVDELKSSYDFEMRDISKLEDREQWVARGQIHLTRRSDKALVAEYVGLAAAQSWNSNWEMVAVCIGPEASFVESNRWKPLQFFFRQVVRIEKMATPLR